MSFVVSFVVVCCLLFVLSLFVLLCVVCLLLSVIVSFCCCCRLLLFVVYLFDSVCFRLRVWLFGWLVGQLIARFSCFGCVEQNQT